MVLVLMDLRGKAGKTDIHPLITLMDWELKAQISAVKEKNTILCKPMTKDPDRVWGSKEGSCEEVMTELRHEEIAESKGQRRTDKKLDRGINMFKNPERSVCKAS